MCATHVYVHSLIFRPPNLISAKNAIQSLGECNVNKALNWTRTHAHLPTLQWDHMHRGLVTLFFPGQTSCLCSLCLLCGMRLNY